MTIREPRRLRCGVVGLGYWGPNLLRVLAEGPDTEVRWICDLDPARLSRVHARYPAARATHQFEELLADPETDAILLATPVDSHYELAMRALLAGKHTFVEKPLAPSVEQADELIAQAAEAGLTLMCGHTFLYSPPVRAVQRLIHDGTLGNIYFISSSRVNLGLHQRDVSVIWDLGPHDFSILLSWLGETPSTVRAVGRDSIVSGVADVAFVTLGFPSGVLASVELSWLAPSKLRRTVIVGSDKMVIYEDGAQEPVRVFDHGVVYRDPSTFGEYQLSYRTGDIVSPKVETLEPLAAEMSDFAAAAAGTGTTPAQTELARDVVRIAQAASDSLLSGGSEVEVPQANGRFRRDPLLTR